MKELPQVADDPRAEPEPGGGPPGGPPQPPERPPTSSARLITTLADRSFEAGSHALAWDGRSADGSAMPSGVYLYVLQTDAGREARSMVLLK